MKDKITIFLQSCKQSKYANWYLAIIFTLTIFLQCCLFHYLAFHSILISSLWKNPLAFWSFYLPKISISVLIAAFVFLFRRKEWTIIVSVLINIWIIVELMYFRANRIPIDAHSFTLIGYLDGFWSSVPMYLQGLDCILFLPTLILILSFKIFQNSRISYSGCLIAVCIGILTNVLGFIGLGKVYKDDYHTGVTSTFHVNPMSDEDVGALLGFTTLEYVRNTSVVHAFIYDLKKLIQMPFERSSYEMSNEDCEQIQVFVNQKLSRVVPKRNLILILVESLESWAIRPNITPNLYKFMQEHNVIWAQNVTSQTKGGTSSDGQFILNTGLLPIQSGAICKRYPSNKYPSLSDIYSSSALIQPGDLSVWNQKYMSDAYSIDTNYLSPQSLDHQTFDLLNKIYDDYSYTLAITMATHSPFVVCSNFSTLELPESMPELMANYLKCLHYSDSCWGELLKLVDKDTVLQNSTICFMGDHIIFDTNMRNEFEKYCEKSGLDYDVQNNHTAIIVYSPNLLESKIIDEVTYQMDAFPTILHLIGCENYYWKGFGVNLLDSVARNNRVITEKDAFILSDKVIRANWFETISDTLRVLDGCITGS